MTNYTKISKPSGTSYTSVAISNQRALWDSPTVTWDSSSATWDGITPYLSVTKASGTHYTNIPKAT